MPRSHHKRLDWEEAKLDKNHEKAVRRVVCDRKFIGCRSHARRYGLDLRQHSSEHYTLRPIRTGGWILSIYPGNRRLYYDRNHPKPPYLRLPPDWLMEDVIRAMSSMEEIQRTLPVDPDAPVGEPGDFDIITFCRTGEVRQIPRLPEEKESR